MSEAEMSIVALPLPLPRWRQRHDSGNLFFITVAAAAVYFLSPSRQLPKKRKFKKLVSLHKIFILKNATL
jgi:hypothetical protein